MKKKLRIQHRIEWELHKVTKKLNKTNKEIEILLAKRKILIENKKEIEKYLEKFKRRKDLELLLK